MEESMDMKVIEKLKAGDTLTWKEGVNRKYFLKRYGESVTFVKISRWREGGVIKAPNGNPIIEVATKKGNHTFSSGHFN